MANHNHPPTKPRKIEWALVSTTFPWFPYSAYTQDPDFRLRTLLILVVSVLPWNNYIISDLWRKTIEIMGKFFTKYDMAGRLIGFYY